MKDYIPNSRYIRKGSTVYRISGGPNHEVDQTPAEHYPSPEGEWTRSSVHVHELVDVNGSPVEGAEALEDFGR